MDIGDVGGNEVMWDAPTAITVAADIFEILLDPGIDAFRVGGISAFQTTDLGDAQHEVLAFRNVIGNTTSGSGGTSANSWPLGIGNFNGLDAAECRNTTAASGGSPVSTWGHGWNILAPLELWYPNGLEPLIYGEDGGGSLNALRLLNAPADSVTMFWQLFLRGGKILT